MNKTKLKSEKLRGLNKSEILALVKRYNYRQIAEMYGISYAMVNSVLSNKFQEFNIGVTKRRRVGKSHKIIQPKVNGFVTTEELLINVGKGVMICKEGLLSFDGTNDLIPVRTELSAVAQNYKKVMKENNIKI